MSTIKARTQAEPVLVGGGIVTVAQAIIGVLLAFELVDWTPEQIGAVLLATGAVTGFLTGAVRSLTQPKTKTPGG